MSDSGLNRWLGLELDEKGEPVFSVKSIWKSIGGPFGLIETAIPPISFSIVFGITSSVLWAVSIALGLAAVIFVLQIVKKRPVMNAIASVLGVAFSAWMALRGGAGDFFIKDFWVNTVWAAGLVLTALFRFPAFGFLLKALGELPDGWRKDRSTFRKMQLLTVMWAGLYALRLSVQLPLYLSGQVVVLGFIKTAFGLPMFGLWCFFTWLIVRKRDENPSTTR